MLTGIEGFFTGIDAIADGIDFIELPLVGGKPFDDLAGSLARLRTDVLGHKSGFALHRRAREIPAGQDGRTRFSRTSDHGPPEAVRRLHTLNSALFAFVVPDRGRRRRPAVRRQRQIKTKLPASAEDIELVLTPEGALTFNIKFGGKLVDGSIAIDLNAGFRHGPSTSTPCCRVRSITCWASALASRAPRRCTWTRAASTPGEEARSTSISTSCRARASKAPRLPQDEVPGDRPTGIHGHFGIDIGDQNQRRPALVLGELPSLALNASASAEANLRAVSTRSPASSCLGQRASTDDQLLAVRPLDPSPAVAKFSSGTPHVRSCDVTSMSAACSTAPRQRPSTRSTRSSRPLSRWSTC